MRRKKGSGFRVSRESGAPLLASLSGSMFIEVLLTVAAHSTTEKELARNPRLYAPYQGPFF